MKTELRETLEKLVALRNRAAECDDIEQMTRIIDLICDIHKDWTNKIQEKVSKEDFKPVSGIDFNVWSYDTQYLIEELYSDFMGKYHSMKFDKDGFCVYEY